MNSELSPSTATFDPLRDTQDSWVIGEELTKIKEGQKVLKTRIRVNSTLKVILAAAAISMVTSKVNPFTPPKKETPAAYAETNSSKTDVQPSQEKLPKLIKELRNETAMLMALKSGKQNMKDALRDEDDIARYLAERIMRNQGNDWRMDLRDTILRGKTLTQDGKSFIYEGREYGVGQYADPNSPEKFWSVILGQVVRKDGKVTIGTPVLLKSVHIPAWTPENIQKAYQTAVQDALNSLSLSIQE